MSFLGQTNSSSGLSNVLSDLSALIADMSSSIEGSSPAAGTGAGGEQNSLASALQNNPQQAGDAFGSSQPNPMNAIGLILEGLGELMQLLGDGQGSSGGTGGTGGSGNSDPYFNSFSASDNGDPHLSFSGDEQGGTPATAGGIQPQVQTANAQPADQTYSKNWNDMNGETDMLHADIGGGRYQLSTDVTTPVANGATLNKSAEISYKGDSVNVNANGQVELSMDGDEFTLGKGQSFDFGNGLKVTNSADGGSTTVSVAGQNGQNVSTTISQGGNFEGQNYLNISSSGNDVRLGGYMVDQATGSHTENDAPANGSVANSGDSMMQFLQEELMAQQENEQNLGGLEQQLSAFTNQQPNAFGGGNTNANAFNAVGALQADDAGYQTAQDD